jgi:hypothetical protein
MKPLERFYNLLELEKRRLSIVFLRNPVRSNQFIITIRNSSHYELHTIRKSKCFCIDCFSSFGVALVGILALMQLRIMENLQQKYSFVPHLNLRYVCLK